MSGSRRKTPVCGITSAASEKADKLAWHRRFRRVSRQRIVQAGEDADASAPLSQPKDVSNPWSMSKDGKRRFEPSRVPSKRRK